MKRFTYDLERTHVPACETVAFIAIVCHECFIVEQHAVAVVMEQVTCPRDEIMISEFAVSRIWKRQSLLPCGSNS